MKISINLLPSLQAGMLQYLLVSRPFQTMGVPEIWYTLDSTMDGEGFLLE